MERKETDNYFMAEALAEARKAFSLGEVPVGALIVHEGRIIAAAHNRVEEKRHVLAHAEMLALEEASRALDNWRLLECTLYSTLEPCTMCASALLLARVKRVVYAAPDLRLGAAGSFINLFAEKHPCHQIIPEKGPFAEESARLLREFFQQRRIDKSIENA